MGGRGALSGRIKTVKRNMRNGGRSQDIHPAYFNSKNKTGSMETSLSSFRDTHNKDKHENLVVLENGYAVGYAKGGKHSVGSMVSYKNRDVIHNHPGNDGAWGSFSGQDLAVWVATGARSMTATSRNINNGNSARKSGTYTITRGSHFKADAFTKAYDKAYNSLSGSNYDVDHNKWLKANARKYGYTYEYTPARNKVTD